MASLTTLELNLHSSLRVNQKRTLLQALLVRRLRSDGLSYGDLGKATGIDSNVCGCIVRGDSYCGIPGGYPSPYYPWGRDAYVPRGFGNVWALHPEWKEPIEVKKQLHSPDLRRARNAFKELKNWLRENY